MAGDGEGQGAGGGPGVSPAGGPVGGFGGSVGVGPGGVTGNPGADAESAAAAGLGDSTGGGTSASPNQAANAIAATEMSQPQGSPAAPAESKSFNPISAPNLAAMLGKTAISAVNPVAAAAFGVGALGHAMSNLAESMGIGVDRSDQGTSPSGTAGEGSGRDEFLKPAAKPPEQPQAPQYARPGAPQPPGTLGFNPAMTPLQQRAQIATYGTQGNQGLYRSPEVKNYYRDLLLRTGITDQGQIQGFDVLPIEQQYANQVLGQPAGLSPEALIEALYKAGPYV